jgi:hypothetical protein
MAHPGIVTAVTTACGCAAAGPIEDHFAAIQARNRRCQGGNPDGWTHWMPLKSVARALLDALNVSITSPLFSILRKF